MTGVMCVDNIKVSSPSSDSFVEKKGKAPPRTKKHKLDSPAMDQLHRDVQTWFDQESQRQASNRFQMALDEDYYDNLQWSEDDAAILEARGQAPVVYNEIKATIDWMIGTERRTRMDYKVLPRRKDGTEDAETKASLLKYLSDVNKSTFHRSRSFDDAIKSGMGVIEVGLRGDPTEELLFERYQDWRSTLYDSNSVEHDLTDARYFFRWKDLDEDIALAYFSDRSDIIKASMKNDGSSDAADWYSTDRTDPSEDWQPKTGRYQPYDGTAFAESSRKVVRFYECWYKKPVMRKIFSTGGLSGMKYDPKNPDHMAAVNEGYGLYDKLEMEVRVVIYTSVGIVFEGASPYRHGKFPFVVTWCYRRKRDNAPYGVTRSLRDAQDGLNKRHSKAHWILSSNGVIMDEGAVDDIEVLREEVARHDYIIVTKPGKRLEINRDVGLANEHLQLMQGDAAYIRKIGGVNDENLGRQTNATSGVAIANRQDQGSVVTTEPFDNHRFALQQSGEMQLSMIEQFYSAEKTIRIIGGRGEANFVDLNKPDESGRIINDITAMQADFVISEQDYKSTMKQAMFESLFDIMGRMSQMGPGGLQAALNMMDLVVDMADLPNKDELVKRIREINGQKDPGAEEDPEAQKAEQAKMQQQAEAAELEKKTAYTNLAMLEAKVEQVIQQNKKFDAERMAKTVDAILVALNAAQVVAAVPSIAAVADEVLKGAGYVDAPQGEDPNIPAQTMPQTMPPQMEQQPQQMEQPPMEPPINQGAMP
jgi:hypothetical protein